MPISPKEIDSLFRVKPGERLRLRDYDPAWIGTDEMRDLGKDALKDRAEAALRANLEELKDAQELLWASDTRAVLVVLQAMDAAGKDGTIKHVMSGVNPQGCRVVSFKQPSAEELDHTYLWRCQQEAPERGQIVLFNRSHYEDVIVTRVHPEWLDRARLPAGPRGDEFWRDRYDDIAAWERHLARNGTAILKIFLHVSKDEQKRRFLDRIEDPKKNWKFSPGDVAERSRWNDYLSAFEDAISATSTEAAPWYIVPADHKWIARALVSHLITRTIKGLDLKFPELSPAQRDAMAAAKATLMQEDA